MNKYFITFMGKQAFRNCYVYIYAENINTARQCAFEHFGREFMTVYLDNDGELEKQIADFGITELATIRAKSIANGELEYALLKDANRDIFNTSDKIVWLKDKRDIPIWRKFSKEISIVMKTGKGHEQRLISIDEDKAIIEVDITGITKGN